MSKRILWLVVSGLMALSLVMAACAPASTPTTPTPTTPAPTTPIPTTPPPTTPTTVPTGEAKWWDKFGVPQYGGTLTFRATTDSTNWDPYFMTSSLGAGMRFETLGMTDWILDRKTYAFQTQYVPIEYRTGLLVQSWEQPNLQTIIFHIRKGIYWQNRAPVNGREFTAYDVEYHYNRLLGLGGGFTKPSPYAPTQITPMTSVNATDKYTVVIKWKTPSLDMLEALLDISMENDIEPREAVEKWGDVKDWKNQISTGPFILNDYVSGSALTYIKNPNYWGYDERHPENKLPYVDMVKILIIPDASTGLAALRTGKIDMATVDWEQAASLEQTNPKLKKIGSPASGMTLDIRSDKAPFTDLRVRTALQMAVDLKTLSKTYYGGLADPTPYGLVGPDKKGYYTPFDEWPQEVKDGYSYNPEGAKKLLAAAGYPNGFKTNVVLPPTYDIDLAQILVSEFAKIGVDMEIRLMDSTAFTNFVRVLSRHDALTVSSGGSSALPFPLSRVLSRRYSTQITNFTHNDDPVYDALFVKFTASLDSEERRKIMIEADNRVIAQHWAVFVPTTVDFIFYQPWFMGYSGENTAPGYDWNLARLWVDQDLKKAMGR